ncbi:hypothetical protein RND71_035691 [Anisodus tanguticus]|uniref:Uncharacterized protein n=1 Tax=Anisodus tanguticus TaxID=243964 RepID=A0AAE1R4Y8_9SOLA|nr:hypothetical protein RND71_035691 [Anisodus tanguticus]
MSSSKLLPLSWLVNASSYNVKFCENTIITTVVTVKKSVKKFELKRIVDVGYLAGKLRKNPKLLNCTLEELMGEVGLDIKKPVTTQGSMRPNWQFSSVLSEEEVKLAMYEVHTCYHIASKLIDDATSSTVRASFL